MSAARLVAGGLLSTALLVGVPASAAAQGSGCEFLPGTSNVTSRPVGQNRVTYLSTPRIRCNDGRYMQADSALQFEASGYSEFIGGVVFRDRGRTLRARHAAYYENLGRLEADGDVVLIEPDGNELRGERLLYLRAGPNRMVEQLVMGGGRPRAVLYPAGDSLQPAGPRPDSVKPYLVDADRIELQGEEIFEASGNVEVERDSLTATSDSLYYDQIGGSLSLVGRPARLVRGELDLVGQRLRILLPGDVIEEVVAREDAVLTTDSLTVTAPFIRLFLEDSEVQRLVAAVPAVAEDDSAASGTAGTGPTGAAARAASAAAAARTAAAAARGGAAAGTAGAGEGEEVDSVPRAVATTREIDMRADSLDVIAPGQRIQRMIAVGSARAVSRARDSLNMADTPELLRYDWIEGDTVVAVFTGGAEMEVAEATPDVAEADSVSAADSVAAPEPVAPADSLAEAQLETLRAVIDARSLYRLDPDSSQVGDTTAFRARLPATYVEAQGILLTFEDGQVVHFLYDGLRRGQQLQPVRLPGELPDTAAVPVDTAASAVDGAAARPDTAASPPDTTVAAAPAGDAPRPRPTPAVRRLRTLRHPFRPTPQP